MEELFKKLKTLQSISGTNDKKTFIKGNKDDKYFLMTLEFLLNDNKITNISKAKMNKKVSVKPDRYLSDLNVLFTYLVNECSGRDVDIANVQWFIEQHKEFEEELKELVTKSMRLGVKAKLVNQVIPGLIPIFGVQLATSYDKCKNKFKNKEIIITEKIDGQKMIAVKQGNKVKFYSRQGKELTGLIEIERDILSINKDSFVMDGELVSANEFDNNEDTYKDTMKKASKKGIKTGLIYMVYDYIGNIEDFFKGRDNTKSINRKENVKCLIKNSNLSYVKYLEPWYIGKDLNKIEEFLLKADDNGKEGICVNISDAPYECKRTPNLAKCKSFKTADLLVYDMFEGDGSLKGTLGGIKLKGVYNGEMLYTDCGSGFTLEERNYLWNHPEEVLNKIVEIKYFNISEDSKTKVKSLRFCTWKGLEYIRVDKNTIKDTSIE